MQNLNLLLVQTKLHWENIEANLKMFDQKLQNVNDEIDLILLPEMFSTGFSMNAADIAEDMDGSAMKWLKEKSSSLNVVITGSLMIKENNQYFNRLIWMTPSQNYQTYDKRHLFSLAREESVYSKGKDQLIVELNGWRINMQICYDLRFPIWNRNRNNYDCLIFVANWPERRIEAWTKLLQARAIENQSYVIGLNRVGTDGNDVYHSGDSCVINPLGEIEFTQKDKEIEQTSILSSDTLMKTRELLPFLADADKFDIVD